MQHWATLPSWPPDRVSRKRLFRVSVGVEDIGLLCSGFEAAIAARQTEDPT
ncbi:hypothetical protein [Roseinatronobacter monicus]|uniref:hypothetical protein n=1 Tax=Roseinatronobacter monicus TaxID=393481 RepID=UPI003F346A61